MLIATDCGAAQEKKSSPALSAERRRSLRDVAAVYDRRPSSLKGRAPSRPIN